jgi:putative DNA primase/helicase
MNDFKQQWLRRTSAARKAPDPNAILRTGGPGALRAAMDEAKVVELHPEEYRFTDDQPRSASTRVTNPAKHEATPTLRPLDIYEFCELAIPKREMVLGPVVPEKGLVMLYAARGTGKTFVGLGAGYAVAAGGSFLKWEAPKPRRVLLIDGEMPAQVLQDRLQSLIDGNDKKPAPGMFQILAADLLDDIGIGNLAAPKTQTKVEQLLDGVEFLILDNLSSLTAVIRDNDAESWNPLQTWLLKLRRRRVSVLLQHHAGKGGDQRGTSRREDVLDTSLSLRRPSDYRPDEGARFEVHVEKGRGVHGEAAKPFEARLLTINGRMEWTTREIEDVNRVRIASMLEDAMSIREIADELGIPKSTVHDIKRKIEESKAAGTEGKGL